MKKRDEHNSTDESEIKELIGRLDRGGLREGDAQMLGRLLRLLLSLLSLVQQKNASIKRLKRMIFGPGSETRTADKGRVKEEGGRGRKWESRGRGGFEFRGWVRIRRVRAIETEGTWSEVGCDG